MDVVLYGQLYNEAMMGMDTLFDDMKDSLKNFSKKNENFFGVSQAMGHPPRIFAPKYVPRRAYS